MIWPLGTLQNCVAYRTFVLPRLPFLLPQLTLLRCVASLRERDLLCQKWTLYRRILKVSIPIPSQLVE